MSLNGDLFMSHQLNSIAFAESPEPRMSHNRHYHGLVQKRNISIRVPLSQFPIQSIGGLYIRFIYVYFLLLQYITFYL